MHNVNVQVPPYQLAVNIPLCDTSAAIDNGPVEIHAGSHRWTPEEGAAAIAEGKVQCQPVSLRAGDCIIRDVRGLHRGTPNRSPAPRPMIVLGYSPQWLRRPEVGLVVPRAYFENASPRMRKLVRFETVVDKLQPYDGTERYGSNALIASSGGSFEEDGGS